MSAPDGFDVPLLYSVLAITSGSVFVLALVSGIVCAFAAAFGYRKTAIVAAVTMGIAAVLSIACFALLFVLVSTGTGL